MTSKEEEDEKQIPIDESANNFHRSFPLTIDNYSYWKILVVVVGPLILLEIVKSIVSSLLISFDI